MGYRPDSQSLKPSASKILEGIIEFRTSVLNRFDADEWSEDHLKEISELSNDLIEFESRLFKIKHDQW